MTTRSHYPLLVLRRKMPNVNNDADPNTNISFDQYQLGTTEVLRASYIWRLENFEELDDGRVIMSPPFGVSAPSASAEKTWCLQLYTRGDSDKSSNYLSLYVLPLKREHREQQQLEGEFLLALLTEDQKRSNVKRLTEAASLVRNSPKWGVSKYLHKDVLTKSDNYLLSGGTLTVFCEVTIKDIGMDSYVPIQRKMHSDFKKLLETDMFSDVTLKAEGKEFKVHKNILSARSNHFYQLFREKPDQHVFNIEQIKCKIMRHLLQFIYGEEVAITSDIAIELMMAAEKYNLEDLKFYCQEVVAEDINYGNVAHIHVQADIVNAKWLKEKTLKFIIDNARDILDTPGFKTLSTHHHELLEEIYRETVKQQCS